jgi:hypothetical protein
MGRCATPDVGHPIEVKAEKSVEINEGTHREESNRATITEMEMETETEPINTERERRRKKKRKKSRNRNRKRNGSRGRR